MLENNCLSKLRLHLVKSCLFQNQNDSQKLMIHKKAFQDLKILRNKDSFFICLYQGAC